MSEQVKNAIDTGLMGLCVKEGDVAAILRRVRQADAPRSQPRTQRRGGYGFRLALVAVMLALVAAVGLRLMSSEPADLTPLDQPEASATQAPGGFVPVSTAEPVIAIDAARAIALAEAHVHSSCDEQADLRDGAAYRISCTYVPQETAEGTIYVNFYDVRFDALTIDGTAYALRVAADDGRILSCRSQRGAAPGSTAQEIWAGYGRVYGDDSRLWTQEQLRTCCQMLKQAQSGSLRWEDYLYLLSSYPDVAEDAMSREEVIAAVEDDLDTLLYEYDRRVSDMPRWTDAERIGGLRARYISAYPNPVWKVAADQRVVSTDGYETIRTVLIEVDSVNGAVLDATAVEALYAGQYESFTASTIAALKATTTSGDGHPGLTDEKLGEIAAAYVREVWGEEHDITDPALFTLTESFGDPVGMQCQLQLTYRSTGPGEVTEYVLYIDDYGQVQAANRSVTPEGMEPFTPTAPALDWRIENLLEWRERARVSAQADDPVMRVFTGTTWLDAYYDGMMYAAARQAAFDRLGVRVSTSFRAVMIDAQPAPVWKLAFCSDRGNFLVEVDSETNEVLHILQVEGVCQSWYLPFVLTADLEAAGVAIPEYAAPAFPLDEPHDTVDGMRIDHLYVRFKEVFGPDMAQWTQEQLRTFQQMAVLSSDYDYDMGVVCLRNTTYPDVPENAISREKAVECAVAAIGNASPEQWQLRGAVLIGTKDGSLAHGTPVWKLCLLGPDGSFWYAEVNCMTGKAYRLHQDASGAASPGASYDYGTPQNLWFRDIVLESTIEDCDVIWDCRGNG